MTRTIAAMRRSAVLVLAAALLLGACSTSGDEAAPTTSSTTRAGATSTTRVGSTSTTTSSTTTSSTTTEPAACTPSADLPVGRSTTEVTIDGEHRSYFVYRPKRLAAHPRLVVQFHGAGSNKEQQAVYSGFEALADEHGFLVATPDGVDAAVRQWRFLNGNGDQDLANAIVERLVRDACVDPAKVDATGISSGGAMTAALACKDADTFTGFGPVAANFYLAPLCKDAPIRPMVIFHGTADRVVPYGGGTVATGQGLRTKGAEGNAAAWAEHNRCDPKPTTEHLSSEVTRISWSGCEAPVVLYRIEGGGHTWPGSRFAVERLGHTTKQIDASKVMWEFWEANE